jgi:hypothetical protein
MKDNKEKVVEVKLQDGETEKVVKVVVKRPNNALLSQAQRISAKSWTDCVRDGIMTKKELEKFMKAQGIWNDTKDVEQKKITEEINRLEKELYVSGKNGKLRATEGKNIAIEMRKKRIELRELIAERMSLEQNTAESISDNARFDFLVANCSYYENGQKVYNNMDEYTANSDSEIAFAAATSLAQMMYSVDRDFEAKLPENKFLKMFNFVNEDLALVNDKGERVDTEGNKIDEFGYYVNEEGKRVDKEGNLLDENGNYVPSITYVDDKGKKINIGG